MYALLSLDRLVRQLTLWAAHRGLWRAEKGTGTMSVMASPFVEKNTGKIFEPGTFRAYG